MSLPSLARLSLHDLQPSPAPTAMKNEGRPEPKPRGTVYREGPKPESKPSSSKGKIEAAVRRLCARLPNVDVRFKTRESIDLQQPIDLAYEHHFDFTWTGEGATKGKCEMTMVAEFAWSSTTTAGPMWHDLLTEENWRPYEEDQARKADAETVKLILFIYLKPVEGASGADAAHWSLEIPLVSLDFVKTALAATGTDAQSYVGVSEEGRPYFDLNVFLADTIPFFSNNYKWKRGKLCHPMRHLTAMFALATDHVVDYMLPGRVVQLYDHAISDVDTAIFVRALVKAFVDKYNLEGVAKTLGIQNASTEGYELGTETYVGVDPNLWTGLFIDDKNGVFKQITKYMADAMLWRAPYYEGSLGAKYDDSDVDTARATIVKKLEGLRTQVGEWLKEASQKNSPALRELIERAMLSKEETGESSKLPPKDKEVELVQTVVTACGDVSTLEDTIAEAGLEISVPFTIRFGKDVAQMPYVDQKRKAALDPKAKNMKVTRTVVDSVRDAESSDDSEDGPSEGSSSDEDDSADSSDERNLYAQKPGFKPPPACRRRKVARGQYTRLTKFPGGGRKPPGDPKPQNDASPETSEDERDPEPASPDDRSDLDYSSDEKEKRP